MTLQGHRESISAVQWMDASTLLTGSWDHTLKVWDLSLEGIKTEISTNKSIFDASYSNLNRLIVTASADKNLRLYDARTNRKTRNYLLKTLIDRFLLFQRVLWCGTPILDTMLGCKRSCGQPPRSSCLSLAPTTIKINCGTAVVRRRLFTTYWVMEKRCWTLTGRIPST